LRKISVYDAVGQVLCHDITQIVPGVVKDRAFKKGHIIEESDIEKLLSLGKENIYVWEDIEGMVHENDAADRLVALSAGPGLHFSEVKEGKINFIADRDGLLKVDVEAMKVFNSLGEMILVSRHNNTPVKKGQKVAGTRIIPLLINEERLNKVETLIPKPIISVKPIQKKRVGIVTTGSEVFTGRIKDAFGPVIKRKVEEFGSTVLGQKILPDHLPEITEAINYWIEEGADLIVCTGGMSVDPDDVTPTAIKNSGAEILTYGSPTLPGAMFLLGYYKEIPILGLPACVMYSRRSVFDLILPRILADERVNPEDIYNLGHGGLCLDCDECRYPNCSFGK